MCWKKKRKNLLLTLSRKFSICQVCDSSSVRHEWSEGLRHALYEFLRKPVERKKTKWHYNKLMTACISFLGKRRTWSNNYYTKTTCRKLDKERYFSFDEIKRKVCRRLMSKHCPKMAIKLGKRLHSREETRQSWLTWQVQLYYSTVFCWSSHAFAVKNTRGTPIHLYKTILELNVRLTLPDMKWCRHHSIVVNCWQYCAKTRQRTVRCKSRKENNRSLWKVNHEYWGITEKLEFTRLVTETPSKLKWEESKKVQEESDRCIMDFLENFACFEEHNEKDVKHYRGRLTMEIWKDSQFALLYWLLKTAWIIQ